jgi:2-polyprenyl-6-hydroxyphenyl methylase/3-demethylubiquinone-9 3-methyltransferase
MIKNTIAPPAKILDVAAAQGNFSLLLAEAGYHVTWNDIRSELVDYVRLKYEVGRLDFLPGNLLNLQLRDTFDMILIAEIIEHVAHHDQFLTTIASMVKPGGFVVLTTPNGGYFRSRLPRFSSFGDPAVFEPVQFSPDADGHIFLLHLDEINTLASECGLEMRDGKLFTNVLTAGHLKTVRLLNTFSRRWIERCDK